MRPTPHRLFLGKDNHKFFVAHMTVLPDGRKERLHGHNYMVSLCVDLRDIAFAHFTHFDVFKKAMEAQCKEWDEHVLVAEKNPFLEVVRRDATEVEFRLCGKRYVLPADEVIFLPLENIVVETLSREFCRRFLERMGAALDPTLVVAIDVTVTETHGQGGGFYHTIGEPLP